MNFLDMIQGTPSWVWFLLVYLIFIGIQALKSSIKPLYALFIMPAVFLFFSIQSVLKDLTTANMLTWIISLSVGGYIGAQLTKKNRINADKRKNLVKIPGAPTTLFLVLSIFLIKYYFGYQLTINPELIYDSSFNVFRLGISGVITGIAMGRAAQIYRKFQHASHTALS